MRIWIWLACAACGGALPSPVTGAAGAPGSLAITSAAELVAPGLTRRTAHLIDPMRTACWLIALVASASCRTRVALGHLP
jgi:hypothetical protein